MHFGKVFLGDHYVESNTLITTTKSMTKREVDQWATYGLTTPFLDCLMISLLYNNILPEKNHQVSNTHHGIYIILIYFQKKITKSQTNIQRGMFYHDVWFDDLII